MFKLGKKYYKEALLSYTEGIELNCKDEQLKSTLYSNRALVNLKLCNFFYIANYKSCINDCLMAIQHNARNIKSYYRIVEAYYKTSKFKECIKYSQKILELELLKDNKSKEYYLDYIKQCNNNLKAIEIEKENKKKREAQLSYDLRLKNQMLKIRNAKSSTNNEILKVTNPTPNIITFEKYNSYYLLGYATTFYYPEYKEKDVIECFYENVTINQQLEYIFETTPSWDDLKHYSNTNDLEIMFEYHPNNEPFPQLIGVNKAHTLQNIIMSQKFFINERAGCEFYVFSKKNCFFDTYKNQIQNS